MGQIHLGDGAYQSNRNGIFDLDVHGFDYRREGTIKKQRQISVNTAPPRREDGACLSCGGEIGAEHIKKFPQTNVCESCYEKLVAKKKNNHQEFSVYSP